ncbi:MAG: hypothetical protein LBJ32_01455 [Oscillospiraceae bacterium]|nr:hypothetical protein [Oscillospiraceae bacterium]
MISVISTVFWRLSSLEKDSEDSTTSKEVQKISTPYLGKSRFALSVGENNYNIAFVGSREAGTSSLCKAICEVSGKEVSRKINNGSLYKDLFETSYLRTSNQVISIYDVSGAGEKNNKTFCLFCQNMNAFMLTISAKKLGEGKLEIENAKKLLATILKNLNLCNRSKILIAIIVTKCENSAENNIIAANSEKFNILIEEIKKSGLFFLVPSSGELFLTSANERIGIKKLEERLSELSQKSNS